MPLVPASAHNHTRKKSILFHVPASVGHTTFWVPGHTFLHSNVISHATFPNTSADMGVVPRKLGTASKQDFLGDKFYRAGCRRAAFVYAPESANNVH